MLLVQVIDTKSNNLSNVLRALDRCDFKYQVIQYASELVPGSLVVLPGVGAFASCLTELQANGFRDCLAKHLNDGGKLLGICVGMQALAKSSTEFGYHTGLSLIDAEVVRLANPEDTSFIVPNVNWLSLENTNDRFRAFAGKAMYFVHSYFMTNFSKETQCAGTVKYAGIDVPAIIDLGNIIGFQFHPEKSGEDGLKILRYSIDLLSRH